MSQSDTNPPIFIENEYEPRLPPPLPSDVDLMEIGIVTAIYGGVVVVKSFSNKPTLDRNSALYLHNREPLGVVYEIVGTAHKPYYVIVHENRHLRPKSDDDSKPHSSKEKPDKLEVEVGKGDLVYFPKNEPSSIILPLERLLLSMRADESGANFEELVAQRETARIEKAKFDVLLRKQQALGRKQWREKRRKAALRQGGGPPIQTHGGGNWGQPYSQQGWQRAQNQPWAQQQMQRGYNQPQQPTTWRRRPV